MPLWALGVGLFGRAARAVFELMAEGKVPGKSLRRVEENDPSLLTTGRNGGPWLESLVVGSSLLLVCL
jgi:hypothetical protein